LKENRLLAAMAMKKDQERASDQEETTTEESHSVAEKSHSVAEESQVSAVAEAANLATDL
jgi:hypothetical protein